MNYTVEDKINLKWLSPLEVVKEIQGAIIKYGESNVVFNVTHEFDFESISGVAQLLCTRDMTKEEKEKKNKEKEEWANQMLEKKKLQYEKLKKEFEDK